VKLAECQVYGYDPSIGRPQYRPGEQVLRERRAQGHESRRIPDQQIVDVNGRTRKVLEAERRPSSQYHRDRLDEYFELGVDYETYGLK